MSAPGTLVIVVDTETTGLAPPAAVIELGYVAGFASIGAASDQTSIAWTNEVSDLFHPGDQVITPENRAIHHIDPADLEDCPYLDETAPMIWELLDADYLVAHQASFDRQWLDGFLDKARKYQAEGNRQHLPRWICTKKCARHVWPDLPSHSNQVLRYALPIAGCTDDELSPPHRALPDALVTSRVLEVLLQAGLSLEEMADITARPQLLGRLPFGKHRGKTFAEVPAGYLKWIIDGGERDSDLIFTAEHELNRRESANG
jgi:exodeoxyribonuclease X